jgi:hypothetical protein
MALTRRFRKKSRRKQKKPSKYQRKTFNLYGFFNKTKPKTKTRKTRKVRKQKGG